MIFIAEKINSVIPSVREAMNQNDEAFFKEMIEKQIYCGADYIDINAAMSENEEEILKGIALQVASYGKCGVSIDSPDRTVILNVLRCLEGVKTMVNSLSLENYDSSLARLAAEKESFVVALPIQGKKMPSTVTELLENTNVLVDTLKRDGVKEENILVDILISSLATNSLAAKISLDFLCELKKERPKVKTVCGLSNISFSLPLRSKVNSNFLAISNYLGLYGAILDVTDENIRSSLKISDMISGNDTFCMKFIKYVKKK